ncbi:glycosyltransferase, group 1 family protein [Selenomonas sp. FOBRC6]|uniref:glycosyltransferase family 4 protein n=1 Tax=Selenomonas sp. FOBRC6 TaxID=936572 RepID=UPI00027828A4|nr:glycosyltransferase [Selenomonas sp. FOBRC6]EJO22859.1 glycosyltransferase, group 1 family protein [Selenomonas sp. FOBRC6]
MNRLLMIFFEDSTVAHLTKEMCSYPYYLGKNHGWICTYAYFGREQLVNPYFEQYCALEHLGDDADYADKKKAAAAYLTVHAGEYDILMFSNYGGASYALARLAKRLNPAIRVYSKLDMNEDGFSHFYDGTFLRKLKVIPEYWKSAAIDLFTVENRSFYNVLKMMRLFRGRLEYLPNPVSLFGVDLAQIKAPQKRENMILTVGRPGVPVKNTELFVEAVQKADRNLFADWKFYIVGEPTLAFRTYVEKLCAEDPWLDAHIILYGRVSDRRELYELYARAKIMCMTSRSEGFPISAVEAIFFGTYLVLTNFGSAIHDLTNGERYGTIVPQEDAAALCRAWKTAAQREDLPVLSREIQAFAREHFNYDRWAAKLHEYLTKLRQHTKK